MGSFLYLFGRNLSNHQYGILTEYVKTQDSIVSELKQLEESVLRTISISLWQYNQSQLEVIVARLLKILIIEGVDILDKYDQPMISKKSYTTDLTPLSISDIKSDLNWQLNEQKTFLGSLILYSLSEVFLDRVLLEFSLIVITEIIKVSILFWLFIWAFDRDLASPLKELMSQVYEVQLSETITKRIIFLTLKITSSYETSNERGVIIDMLAKIYSSKNYKLEYYEVPLARGLDMVAEGLCDMLPEYLFSKQAEKISSMPTKQHFHT